MKLKERALRSAVEADVGVEFAEATRMGTYSGRRKVEALSIRYMEETGGMVIRPPSAVLPPKRFLGYHSKGLASHNEILRWYREQTLKPVWGRDLSLQEKLKEVREIERENGLQCLLSTRAQVIGELSENGCSIISSEIHDSGQIATRTNRVHNLEAQSEVAPFVTCTVHKYNVRHNMLVGWLCGHLGVEPKMIGIRVIGESLGHVTQSVFIKADQSDVLSRLNKLAGLSSVGSGIVHISSISTTATVPKPGKGTAVWCAINSIQASPQMFYQELRYFESVKRYVNFFTPSVFDVPKCRHVPLWAVGWHLYRFDDINVVGSIIAHSVIKHYPKYRDLLNIPVEKWKNSGTAKHLLGELRVNRSGYHHFYYVLDAVISGKGVRGVTTGLCKLHDRWVGEALSAFLKMLWNMLVSARVADVGRDSSPGDVIITDEGIPQINYDGLPMTNVVFPLADAFTSNASVLWPHHRYSKQTAHNLLAAFGLTPADIDRLHHLLPPDFLATPYRRVAGTIDKFEYQVHPSPISLKPDIGPLHIADANLLQRRIEASDTECKPGHCEAALFMTTELGGSGYAALRETALLKVTHV
eukprot:TRINITY_DN12697_c0_g1_i1.p1 TRINITY_DN12697_c0_g1~~TRINITY_DN12697_c0_g1_i1.p1  ORF type:complete len:585 (+),score=151.95 TRINITY_DN12697_c0_g1_i1:86-1840(+)